MYIKISLGAFKWATIHYQGQGAAKLWLDKLVGPNKLPYALLVYLVKGVKRRNNVYMGQEGNKIVAILLKVFSRVTTNSVLQQKISNDFMHYFVHVWAPPAGTDKVSLAWPVHSVIETDT